MNDFFEDVERISTKQELIMNIVTELPDCVPEALTVIAMVVDKYAAKHHIRSSSLWKVLTGVAAEVHNEMGDCK